MKRVVTTLAIASSFAMASSQIMALKYNGDLSKLDASSTAWKVATPIEVLAYPQTTIKMNDKVANRANENNSAKRVHISALYNSENIAFKVEWADGSENVYSQDSTDSYADGFAIQFAQSFSDTKRLPYIGMGSENREVVVHLNKAYEGVYEPNGDGDIAHQVNPNNRNIFKDELKDFNKKVSSLAKEYQRSFVAQGFRSTTEVDIDFHSDMSYNDNKWSTLISRSLKDDYLNLNKGAIPIAIAIWDGHKLNRDGLKHITNWLPVKLIGKSGGEDLIKSMTTNPSGDIENGKEQFVTNCAACHNINSDSDMAPTYMAPNLSNIGGYSLASYLKESIKNPSAVVVPGYNRNAHKNYEWYTLNDNKERISTMPAYDWMDDKTIDDIVAYLQTLKAKVK